MGWGEGGCVTSYIWHSMDVCAEWPPFSALPGIWLAPFFQQKVYDWPHFSGLVYERPHFSDVSWYMHIFFVQIFFEATCSCSLGIQWNDCYICLTTSNKWVQNIKGRYMNGSAFQLIKYMNGSIFSKARHMIGVGFEILARTPTKNPYHNYPQATHNIPPPLPKSLHV